MGWATAPIEKRTRRLNYVEWRLGHLSGSPLDDIRALVRSVFA
jgi:hypothetical protein